ncbi:MAG: carboxypeptidase regulatory-like domain-containing protein [Candidatus Methylomirabilales bacterium]
MKVLAPLFALWLLLLGEGAVTPEIRPPGTLTGRVVFVGLRPEPLWEQVRKHRAFCGDRQLVDRLKLSADGGVLGAVVILTGPPARRHPAADPVALLDNRGCQFLPRVQVAPVGSRLIVRNSDPILHTAHARLPDGGTLFHVALPHFRDRTEAVLAKPGLVRIVCDVGHTWMGAYILVTDNPLVVVTDREGHFRIDGVPPGSYALQVWHETLGTRQRAVSVPSGGEVTVTIRVSPPEGPVGR